MTRRGALVALAALPLAACGKKSRPLPPERRRPQAVTDLTAAVREDRIELVWTNPRRHVDNSRMFDLAMARVFRFEDSGAGEPKAAIVSGDRVVGYTEVAAIAGGNRLSAVAQGDRVVYPDRNGLQVGRRYSYVVITTDAQGRTSPPSRRVTVTFLAAPEPPGDVQAKAGEGSARVSWTPPVRTTDGTAISGGVVYDVLRATAAEGPFTPVKRTAPGETSIEDRNLENDRTYWYAVRALREESGTTVEGAASPAVAVTPVKVTPPAPPRELVAIPSQGAVRLSWAPSPSGDVATYVVYRATASGQFTRIGAVAPPVTTFLDRDVPRGVWRYAVTAQDGAARPNESARSNVVRVSVP